MREIIARRLRKVEADLDWVRDKLRGADCGRFTQSELARFEDAAIRTGAVANLVAHVRERIEADTTTCDDDDETFKTATNRYGW